MNEEQAFRFHRSSFIIHRLLHVDSPQEKIGAAGVWIVAGVFGVLSGPGGAGAVVGVVFEEPRS